MESRVSRWRDGPGETKSEEGDKGENREPQDGVLGPPVSGDNCCHSVMQCVMCVSRILRPAFQWVVGFYLYLFIYFFLAAASPFHHHCGIDDPDRPVDQMS